MSFYLTTIKIISEFHLTLEPEKKNLVRFLKFTLIIIMQHSSTQSSLDSNGSAKSKADIAMTTKAKHKLATMLKAKSKSSSQTKQDLSDCKTLLEAFTRFGYGPEDNVRIHDRVRIYQQVARDMKAKLADLRHRRYHLAAKGLQKVFDGIRTEYDIIYRKDESRRQTDELKKLEKAMIVIRQKYDVAAATQREKMIDHRHEKELDLKSLQAAQTNILEHFISRLPKPKKRASTKMLAMIQAEEHLSKNKQYDEAQHMKHLISKLEPIEKKKFNDDYQQTLAAIRHESEKRQAFMRKRLAESVDTHEWALKRKMLDDHQRLHRRLKNNENTMEHAHLLRSFLEPQRTKNPAVPVRSHCKIF